VESRSSAPSNVLTAADIASVAESLIRMGLSMLANAGLTPTGTLAAALHGAAGASESSEYLAISDAATSSTDSGVPPPLLQAQARCDDNASEITSTQDDLAVSVENFTPFERSSLEHLFSLPHVNYAALYHYLPNVVTTHTQNGEMSSVVLTHHNNRVYATGPTSLVAAESASVTYVERLRSLFSRTPVPMDVASELITLLRTRCPLGLRDIASQGKTGEPMKGHLIQCYPTVTGSPIHFRAQMSNIANMWVCHLSTPILDVCAPGNQRRVAEEAATQAYIRGLLDMVALRVSGMEEFDAELFDRLFGEEPVVAAPRLAALVAAPVAAEPEAAGEDQPRRPNQYDQQIAAQPIPVEMCFLCFEPLEGGLVPVHDPLPDGSRHLIHRECYDEYIRFGHGRTSTADQFGYVLRCHCNRPLRNLLNQIVPRRGHVINTLEPFGELNDENVAQRRNGVRIEDDPNEFAREEAVPRDVDRLPHAAIRVIPPLNNQRPLPGNLLDMLTYFYHPYISADTNLVVTVANGEPAGPGRVFGNTAAYPCMLATMIAAAQLVAAGRIHPALVMPDYFTLVAPDRRLGPGVNDPERLAHARRLAAARVVLLPQAWQAHGLNIFAADLDAVCVMQAVGIVLPLYTIISHLDANDNFAGFEMICLYDPLTLLQRDVAGLGDIPGAVSIPPRWHRFVQQLHDGVVIRRLPIDHTIGLLMPRASWAERRIIPQVQPIGAPWSALWLDFSRAYAVPHVARPDAQYVFDPLPIRATQVARIASITREIGLIAALPPLNNRYQPEGAQPPQRVPADVHFAPGLPGVIDVNAQIEAAIEAARVAVRPPPPADEHPVEELARLAARDAALPELDDDAFDGIEALFGEPVALAALALVGDEAAVMAIEDAVAAREPEPALAQPPAPHRPFDTDPYGLGHPFPLDDNVVYVGSSWTDTLPGSHWVVLPCHRHSHVPDPRPFGTSCTCMVSGLFSAFFPCKHLRRARTLILGPGVNTIPFLGTLLTFKRHFYAALSHGQLLLRIHADRATWMDTRTAVDRAPQPVNPAGGLVHIAYAGRDIPIQRHGRFAAVEHGQRLTLYRPISRLAYVKGVLSNACRALIDHHTYINMAKGVLSGMAVKALELIGDPALICVTETFNMLFHAIGLPASIMLPTGGPFHYLCLAIQTVLHSLGIGVMGQGIIIVLVIVMIKTSFYYLFKEKLGMDGAACDIGFAVAAGIQALPVLFVKWLMTPPSEPALTYGFPAPENPTLASNAEPAAQAQLLLQAYVNSRTLLLPSVYNAAATGIVNYANAAEHIQINEMDVNYAIVTEGIIERRYCGMAYPLEIPLHNEFNGIEPPKGQCFNYPYCKNRLVKLSKGKRNFNLCPNCLQTHPRRPGTAPHFFIHDDIRDGVRWTGTVPLFDIRRSIFLPPEGTVAYVAPGCSLRSTLQLKDLWHPDNNTLGSVGLVVGYFHPGWLPGHQPGGPSSIYLGLLERTFLHGQTYSDRAMDRYQQFLHEYTATLEPGVVVPMDIELWLKSQEREMEMRAAHAANQQFGLLPEDIRAGIFAKSEWVLSSKPGRGLYGMSVPQKRMRVRNIYMPSDKSQAKVGPTARSLAEDFKQHLGHPDGNFIYCGAMDPPGLNRVLHRFEDLKDTHHFVMTDISKCETNKHDRIVDARMKYYRHRLQYWDPDFEKVMSGWRRMKFSARSKGKRFSGRLPPNMTLSGEVFTSLDNSMDINILFRLILVCALLNLSPEALPKERLLEYLDHYTWLFLYAGTGDDGISAIPKVFDGRVVDIELVMERMRKYAEMFGFLLKTRLSKNFVDLVFLGCRPYWTTDGYRWGRLIGRASFKHHCARDLAGCPYEWLHNVAAMEMRTLPHVPILYHMAATIDKRFRARKGGPKPLKQVDQRKIDRGMRWVKYVDGHGTTYTDRTIAELADVYSTTPEAILGLIDQIERAKWFPYALSGDLWDTIIAQDTGY